MKPQNTRQHGLSRREFVLTTGATAGGLMVGFHVPAAQAVVTGTREINAWVVIHPSDEVVIRIARSEMGQGTLTGLAQLVAEELDCDWARVTTEFPTPGQNLARQRAWGDMSTGGSRGIRTSHDYVRRGGAAARTLLVEAAAEAWGVPVAECTAERGVVTHGPSKRKFRYGQVAAAAAMRPAPDLASLALKDPRDWKIAGHRLARLDTVDKTTGAQQYGIDLRLPGMLNAAIRDCPVFGGTVRGYDAQAVMGRPGVKKVVQVDSSAVAVIADTWWQARTAVEALPIDWDLGPNAQVQQSTINELLRRGRRPAACPVRGLQAVPGRRFRAARPQRLLHAGRAAGQVHARHAGQAGMDA